MTYYRCSSSEYEAILIHAPTALGAALQFASTRKGRWPAGHMVGLIVRSVDDGRIAEYVIEAGEVHEREAWQKSRLAADEYLQANAKGGLVRVKREGEA